jgi:hypothetical protein
MKVSWDDRRNRGETGTVVEEFTRIIIRRGNMSPTKFYGLILEISESGEVWKHVGKLEGEDTAGNSFLSSHPSKTFVVE